MYISIILKTSVLSFTYAASPPIQMIVPPLQSVPSHGNTRQS